MLLCQNTPKLTSYSKVIISCNILYIAYIHKVYSPPVFFFPELRKAKADSKITSLFRYTLQTNERLVIDANEQGDSLKVWEQVAFACILTCYLGRGVML